MWKQGGTPVIKGRNPTQNPAGTNVSGARGKREEKSRRTPQVGLVWEASRLRWDSEGSGYQAKSQPDRLQMVREQEWLGWWEQRRKKPSV